eukprot:12494012-Prorocentrum_lima.AAC.1
MRGGRWRGESGNGEGRGRGGDQEKTNRLMVKLWLKFWFVLPFDKTDQLHFLCECEGCADVERIGDDLSCGVVEP